MLGAGIFLRLHGLRICFDRFERAVAAGEEIFRELRFAARGDIEHVVEHENLPVRIGARADADDGYVQLFGNVLAERRRNAFEQHDIRTRPFERLSVAEHALGGLVLPALHAEAADFVNRLRLEPQVRTHGESLAETSRAVVAGMDRAASGTGEKLERSAGELARAAVELRGGVEAILPQVRSLSGDLTSLAREVAMLAAERDEAEVSSVVLTELERLGESVERLARMFRGADPGDEAPSLRGLGREAMSGDADADEDELPPGETQ